MRRQEAEAADELARRSVPDAASRSGPGLATFIRPAPGPVTSVFGERRGSGRHPGIDFDGDTGDPVVAAAAATVAFVGPAPAGYAGYGTIVLLDHGGGVQTLYAHLSATTVRPRQAVLAGEHIGAIGTTGVVSGSHLHFEVRQGGAPVNPRPWLAG
ncbi:MAG: M23 family metallopeptidase [Actinobacteria bacterium]|nr:M23 family metallopeptidase [Actinomycetota bacterium]